MIEESDSYTVTNIEFSAEGVVLRGWLYRPKSEQKAAPVVVMAHGYNCLKEFYLDKYAASVATAGHVVVAYDHRNFGESDGEPRQELDPWVQVRDYRHAITFAQGLDGVDADRVGIWGSSYAGGHVLVVGAIDRRVKCVAAQVPTISGWESTIRRTPPPAIADQRRMFDADRLERFHGGAPKMVPMVIEPSGDGLASHASSDAWSFFTGQLSPPEDQWRFSKWRNEVTLRSLELYSEYEPGSFVERIGPTPLLMVVGDSDVVCPTDLALEAFNRARDPKRLELFPGGHFAAYTDQFDRAANAATQWFAEHL